MNYQIENEQLIITASSRGAELISIISKKSGTEYLWQGKSERWEGKSPVLFPIIASVENDQYRVGDNVYHLGLHGFAMHKNFRFVRKKHDSLGFSLDFDEDTIKVYPFKFTLEVTYVLKDNSIQTIYTVTNVDDKPIWFCMGGHPTFACPLDENLNFTDYHLKFEQKETAPRHLMTGPLMNGKTEPFLDNQDEIPLSKSLFKENAVILKNLKSKWIDLLSSKDSKQVRLSIDGFPHLGIFSYAESEEDKYICVEPWHGIPGVKGKEKDFRLKEGIIELQPNRAYTMDFSITIFD
ncbi:MAG: aldose 1-epimerase family protein [Bacteroidales bacterium]